MNSNAFLQQDYIAARQEYLSWRGEKDETVDEYVLRKRQAELNALVRRVIKNELSEDEIEVVKLHWYQGLSKSETAEKLGVDRSTVSRRLQKINNIIYDKLKYAIEYRYGKSNCPSSDFIIKNAEARRCTLSSDEISKKIRFERTKQCFTIEDVSKMTGISRKRLEEIEENGYSLTMIELKKLAVLYRISADSLVFGTKGELH